MSREPDFDASAHGCSSEREIAMIREISREQHEPGFSEGYVEILDSCKLLAAASPCSWWKLICVDDARKA